MVELSTTRNEIMVELSTRKTRQNYQQKEKKTWQNYQQEEQGKLSTKKLKNGRIIKKKNKV